MALAQLLRSSGSIALEDPGYPRLQRIYSSLGLAVCPVALDDEGIDMAQLRSSKARIAHVMPSHQFPTGIVTSIARRYELLGWASEHEDAYLIEDDYDATFRMSGHPIASLASIDVEGRVIYTNTFSKSLGPAIRAAFMVLPEALADRWDAAAGFYSNTVSAVDQVALARMLESGDYERHVNRYRKAQREVRDALIDELRRQDAAARMHVEQEDSGLHFVLVIEGTDDHELASRALAKGVRLAPLSRPRWTSPTLWPSGRRGGSKSWSTAAGNWGPSRASSSRCSTAASTSPARARRHASSHSCSDARQDSVRQPTPRSARQGGADSWS